jgi:hypothetical protein
MATSERKKAVVFLSSASQHSALRIFYSALTVRKFQSESDTAVFAFTDDEKTAALLAKIGVKPLQTGELYFSENCHFEGSKNCDEMTYFFSKYDFDCIFLKENTYALKNFSPLFKILAQRNFLLYNLKGNFKTPERKYAKSAALLVKKGIAVYEDTFVKVPPETNLWSSELIGVPFLGKNAVEKTKKMACRLSKKIRQEVFEPTLSFMFGEHGKIFSAVEYFDNYADFPEFDEVLKDFAAHALNADRAEIFELAEKIAVGKLRAPKIEFFSKNAFQRAWLSFNKKQWVKPDYSFD